MKATAKQNRPGLTSRRRFLRFVAAVLAGAGLIFGLSYGYWQFFQHRMTTISEGEVYHSAQMGPKALEKAVREYGLRSVLDLRAADEDPEQVARLIPEISSFSRTEPKGQFLITYERRRRGAS